jgi:hypothetical protein
MSWIICPDEKNGLLDIYPGAAAAYSLRNLQGRSGKNSAVVRVRRDNDDAEQDFTATEVGDGTLAAWVGSGNDGFVRTWYDQSGNNYNAEQTTTSAQPKIVSSGSLLTENGKTALSFDGTDDGLVVANSKSSFKFLHDGTTSTSFATVNQTAASITSAIFHTAYATKDTGTWLQILDASGQKGWRATVYRGVLGSPAADYTENNVITINKQSLLYALVDANAINAADRVIGAVDGSAVFSGNTLTNARNTGNATNDFRIGHGIYRGNTGGHLLGTMQELIIYNSDQSTNRAAIEANINAHYSIF